jgi:hypothetical protein
MSKIVDTSDENVQTNRYKFAFVIDDDVAMILIINPHELQAQQTQCLRNNPEIIEVEPNEGDAAKFNFINDGVVNYTIDLPEGVAYERYIACLRSNPVIMEVSSSNPVRSGWKYNGSHFYAE